MQQCTTVYIKYDTGNMTIRSEMNKRASGVFSRARTPKPSTTSTIRIPRTQVVVPVVAKAMATETNSTSTSYRCVSIYTLARCPYGIQAIALANQMKLKTTNVTTDDVKIYNINKLRQFQSTPDALATKAHGSLRHSTLPAVIFHCYDGITEFCGGFNEMRCRVRLKSK